MVDNDVDPVYLPDVRFGNDLPGTSQRAKPPLLKQRDPVTVKRRQIHIMRNGHDGEACAAAKRTDQIEGADLVGDVEGCGGFIQEDDLRFL
ncbi:MAG TPA: hypothetical protein DCZ97_04725, partial [Syntrophus sp. (in: bacteria)]|nr:hypothetical protein [Syntrophus sp. (in: bacteria)]